MAKNDFGTIEVGEGEGKYYWFIHLAWDKWVEVAGNHSYVTRKGAVRAAERFAARLGIRIQK